MAYLILLLLLGAGGITRLMIAQRRRHSELQTVEGFRTSLEAISQPVNIGTSPAMNRFDQRRARTTGRTTGTMASSRELDPERRAAARHRIEERRAARRSALG